MTNKFRIYTSNNATKTIEKNSFYQDISGITLNIKDNFSKFEWSDELRNNSKTFILSGSYSSRLDVKRLNTECCYKLPLVDKLQKQFKFGYDNLIAYAYKLLLQNQAHDGICGCSLDDVHAENIMRYKKILQICQTIIDEFRFKNELKAINLGDKPFTGYLVFESCIELEYCQKISSRKGFDNNILQDT